jgi:hypothetical protein
MGGHAFIWIVQCGAPPAGATLATMFPDESSPSRQKTSGPSKSGRSLGHSVTFDELVAANVNDVNTSDADGVAKPSVRALNEGIPIGLTMTLDDATSFRTNPESSSCLAAGTYVQRINSTARLFTH